MVREEKAAEEADVKIAETIATVPKVKEEETGRQVYWTAKHLCRDLLATHVRR